MSVILEFSPEKEAHYAQLAQAEGLSLPEFVQKLVERAALDAEVRAKNAKAREVLRRMEQEDAEYWATLSESEKEAARADWENFKGSMNGWAMSDRRRFTQDD